MKQILLVEDEEMLVNVLASVLQDEGFTVRKSTSAEDALELLPGFRPDLIISDIKLDSIDGFTMLESIRSTKRDAKIPSVSRLWTTAAASSVRGHSGRRDT